jgi:integrase
MRQLLGDGIDDYLAFRKSQDYSKNTLSNERVVLRRFLTVTGNIYIDNVTERHVTRHFEEAGKTRQAAALRMDHTYLGLFFDWARQTRRMKLDMDPMHGRRKPRIMHRERNRIHVSKFPHLLDLAGAEDRRDRAVIAVLLYTLVRDQEAANLRIRDLDLDGGWLKVRVTKTGKEDMMPVCSELDAELRAWLSYYTTECGPLQPNWFLLPRRMSVGIIRSGEGGKIAGHSMVYCPDLKMSRTGRHVMPILAASGFPVTDVNGETLREGSHTLRRSGARALFDSLAAAGYDHSLRIVQSMLHHSSVAVTERYIGLDADRRTRDDILRGKPMYPGATGAAKLRMAQ